jgi:hypothetical protein
MASVSLGSACQAVLDPFYVDIGHDHLARCVHIISEQTGGVVLVLLNDFVITDGGVQSLAAGGQLRNADEDAALVKVGALFSKADLDRRTAAGVSPSQYETVSRGAPVCAPP